jgi:NADH-quinone oxidoreductase subunit N
MKNLKILFLTFKESQNFEFEIFQNCYLAIYSELFLILTLISLIIFLVVIEYNSGYKIILTVLTGKIILGLYILVLLINNNNYTNFVSFNDLIILDNFNIFIKNVLIFSLIAVILMSLNYVRIENINNYEYFILIGFASIGMFIISTANDLITMYLGIEMQSLCFYVLAAIKVHNNFSTEAGLKYFILGAFASNLLLFGCSFTYGALGTTNFSEMKILTTNFSIFNLDFFILLFGIIFIIIAILFKIGTAPFHMWVPDVYEGSPTIVTALFSIVPKVALFGLFIRLQFNLFYTNFIFFQDILLYCSLLSIFVGTLGALYQTKLKRLIAYSAINHVGFLLISLISFNSFSVFALFFYLIIYIVLSINIFTVLTVLRKVDNNLKIKKINELSVLFKSNPLLAINFCLILFSMAGIPPLAGFYSKFYIFISAIKSDFYLIATIAAIFSVIASMYYIRLIKLMFFKNFEYWTLFIELSKKESLLISFTFFFNLFFICYPEIFVLSVYNLILQFFY